MQFCDNEFGHRCQQYEHDIQSTKSGHERGSLKHECEHWKYVCDAAAGGGGGGGHW